VQKVKWAACDEEEGKRKKCSTECPKIGQNLCIISRLGGMGLLLCDNIEETPLNKVGCNLRVTRVTESCNPAKC